MILYTGGKYQGKLEASLDEGVFTYDDVFDFGQVNKPEYSQTSFADKKIWYHLEDYIRSLAMMGTDASQIESMIKRLIEDCSPEVVIISETGAGVIPISEHERSYREVCGKISVELAKSASEVYRVICGLKVKIK